MKKLFITIALLAFATSAMAAATIDSDGTTFTDGSTFKTSALVTLAVDSDGTDYNAGTKHTNGTKAYLGTNSDPEIFEDSACEEKENITAVPAASSPITSSSTATCS
jgi:hypothetical protein